MHTHTHTHTHTEHKNSLKRFWTCDSCQLDHTLWVAQEFRQKHQSKDPAVLECIQPPLPLGELEFILATVFYSGVSLSLISGNCLVIHGVENDSICNYNYNYIYIYLCTHTDSRKHRYTSWLMDWVFSPAQGAEVHNSVNVRVACLILFKHNDPILRMKYIKGENCCSVLLCVKFNNMIVWPLNTEVSLRLPGAALTILLAKIGTDPLTATDVVPAYTSNKFSPVISSTPITKKAFWSTYLKNWM